MILEMANENKQKYCKFLDQLHSALRFFCSKATVKRKLFVAT